MGYLARATAAADRRLGPEEGSAISPTPPAFLTLSLSFLPPAPQAASPERAFPRCCLAAAASFSLSLPRPSLSAHLSGSLLVALQATRGRALRGNRRGAALGPIRFIHEGGARRGWGGERKERRAPLKRTRPSPAERAAPPPRPLRKEARAGVHQGAAGPTPPRSTRTSGEAPPSSPPPLPSPPSSAQFPTGRHANGSRGHPPRQERGPGWSPAPSVIPSPTSARFPLRLLPRNLSKQNAFFFLTEGRKKKHTRAHTQTSARAPKLPLP